MDERRLAEIEEHARNCGDAARHLYWPGMIRDLCAALRESWELQAAWRRLASERLMRAETASAVPSAPSRSPAPESEHP